MNVRAILSSALKRAGPTNRQQWSVSQVDRLCPPSRAPVVMTIFGRLAIVLLLLLSCRTELMADRGKSVGDVPPDARETEVRQGWVSLFNGRDLTGWKVHPKQRGKWSVKNGVLIGTGPVSHLYSSRGDYRNFHAYVEMKVGRGGDSGFLFRSESGPNRVSKGSGRRFPAGYQVDARYPRGPAQIGWLCHFPSTAHVHILKSSVPAPPSGKWFTLEVLAIDNHIVIRVDGKVAVDHRDKKRLYREGHLAFQWLGSSSVNVRRTLVHRLPDSLPPFASKSTRFPPPPTAMPETDRKR